MMKICVRDLTRNLGLKREKPKRGNNGMDQAVTSGAGQGVSVDTRRPAGQVVRWEYY